MKKALIIMALLITVIGCHKTEIEGEEFIGLYENRIDPANYIEVATDGESLIVNRNWEQRADYYKYWIYREEVREDTLRFVTQVTWQYEDRTYLNRYLQYACTLSGDTLYTSMVRLNVAYNEDRTYDDPVYEYWLKTE